MCDRPGSPTSRRTGPRASIPVRGRRVRCAASGRSPRPCVPLRRVPHRRRRAEYVEVDSVLPSSSHTAGSSLSTTRTGIDHRLVHVVVDGDEFDGGTGDLTGVGDHDRQHVAEVRGATALGDHHRPVLVDDADASGGGDVGSGEDRMDAVDVERSRPVDAHDVRTSVVGEAQRAVQHAGGAHVVDEVPRADRKLAAFVLHAARADTAGLHDDRAHRPVRALRPRRAP